MWPFLWPIESCERLRDNGTQSAELGRPPIPNELRRRVLVEAGHRCAIHTRKHTDVDVHHIIPWERCKEHSYHNLIALCPNCHRRADSGEIDRKALRMYKARLTSASISSDEALALTDDTSPLRQWQVVRVAESRSDSVRYDVEIELPSFGAPDLAEINQIEYAWALSCIQSFRRMILSPIQWAVPRDDSERLPAGYLSGTFTVTLFTDTALSLRYAISEYHYGAMHGQSSFRTITALRKPLLILEFTDLFDENSDFLERVSSFSIKTLIASHPDFDPDWVRRGAGPDFSNFTDFNVSEDGLLIMFPPYQAASWADGPQQVTIPWSELSGVLNRRCLF